MVNRSGRTGTAWETEVANTLIAHGWLYAERRRLNGRFDRGDISGIPGVVIEAKAAKKHELAGWLKEAHEEAENDSADHGFVWFKRRGKASAADGFVLMDGHTVMMLLTAAGYGGTTQLDIP